MNPANRTKSLEEGSYLWVVSERIIFGGVQ